VALGAQAPQVSSWGSSSQVAPSSSFVAVLPSYLRYEARPSASTCCRQPAARIFSGVRQPAEKSSWAATTAISALMRVELSIVSTRSW
jgi:hypothetical protein